MGRGDHHARELTRHDRGRRLQGDNPSRPPSIDEVAARFAADQHGIVTRQQLLGAGVPSRVVERRVTRRRLRPVHRGVYLVGPVAPPRAPEKAACLACGPDSAVSHASASAFWQMTPPRKPGVPVHILVVGHGRRRPGILVHRTARLHPGEVVRSDGIPFTSPARTLYDLAEASGFRVLERALARALKKELTTQDELEALLKRYAGRPGTTRLRSLLGDAPPAFVRSEAEARFLELVRAAGLPRPQVNVRLGPYEADFYWPARRVVVEIDGFEFHSSPAAFERDRERDAELAARGLRVTRITWKQLTRARDAVLVRLARTLGGP